MSEHSDPSLEPLALLPLLAALWSLLAAHRPAFYQQRPFLVADSDRSAFYRVFKEPPQPEFFDVLKRAAELLVPAD